MKTADANHSCFNAETHSAILTGESPDETIFNKHIEDMCLSEIALTGRSFENVIFERCRLAGCSFKKSNFMNVVFKACDISNCDFRNSFFKRCKIDSSRGLGTNFSGVRLIDTDIIDSNLKYADFDSATFKKTVFIRTDLSDSYLTKCTFNSVKFNSTQLNHATFFKTSLKGIDLSDSEIEGLIVSSEANELQGVIIDRFQAAEVVHLLGVIVK